VAAVSTTRNAQKLFVFPGFSRATDAVCVSQYAEKRAGQIRNTIEDSGFKLSAA